GNEMNSKTKKMKLVNELINLGKRIDKAGFQPIALINDLRTDYKDLFVVDFGQDLGGFYENSNYSFASNLVNSFIEKNEWYSIK
ncbi:hypothetical protein KJ742_05400, partial [Patescibacteria group bacterium]|nr:hypothetical protein [Patescibacteria group bacterium]